MDECKAMRISILEPDVNESELNFTVNKKGDIRYGLGGIKGVGEGAVEAIVSEREKNGKYKDIYDFLERVNLQACNRKTVENLATSGAFDSFEGIYREQILAIGNKGEAVLDTLMRYGNTFQQDKAQQQNSLFGDLGDGFAVDIYKPELPKVPRMSAIEKLNKEKDLIGIFLSAHPLDEYEFEVRDMCNVTAAELTHFDSWRTPDARKAAENAVSEEDEADTNRISPTEWIAAHENQPLHFGGIVTSAEEAISQKGNPYGRYVIEDYSGAYKMPLFGNTYKTCAPLLKPNLYVYITGTIQQRGVGMKWFKPKPAAEAEYEFVVQNVELLKDAQDKHIETLTLRIPVEQVTKEFNEELLDMLKAHKGSVKLRLQIFDQSKQNVINFNANSFPVHVDKELYHYLKIKEMEEVFTHKVS